jgi:hypothetical protein
MGAPWPTMGPMNKIRGVEFGEPQEPEIVVIERAALNDSGDGRMIAASFVEQFGQFMTETVRPVLRQVAIDGGEPQLLVNGLAGLLRLTADSIEFPLEAER